MAQPPAAPLNPRVAGLYPARVDLIWVASNPKGSPIVGHALELKRLRRQANILFGKDPIWTDPPTSSGSREVRADAFVEAVATADGIISSLDIGYRNQYQADNLEPSATYAFRVAACNSEGQGDWSPWSAAFPGGRLLENKSMMEKCPSPGRVGSQENERMENGLLRRRPADDPHTDTAVSPGI